ncbi:unnamed protein product [Lampetra planeri]
MAVARGRRGSHVGGGDITACGGGPPRDQTRGVGDTKRGCSARDRVQEIMHGSLQPRRLSGMEGPIA